MQSAFSYQITQDRIAELHRQARHDALARAARRSRRALRRQSRHHVPGLPAIVVRRVRTALATHT